jgi:hypothetical protein
MPKLAIICWLDAVSPAATHAVNIADIASVHQSLPIQTVGWILFDDDKGITVAGESCQDGDYRSITHIPRSLITEIRTITIKRIPKVVTHAGN